MTSKARKYRLTCSLNACKTGSGTNRSKATHSNYLHIFGFVYMYILARAHSTYYSDYLYLHVKSDCLNNSQTKSSLIGSGIALSKCFNGILLVWGGVCELYGYSVVGCEGFYSVEDNE